MLVLFAAFVPVALGATAVNLTLFGKKRYAFGIILLMASIFPLSTVWALGISADGIAAMLESRDFLINFSVVQICESLVVLPVSMILLRRRLEGTAGLGPTKLVLLPSVGLPAGIVVGQAVLFNTESVRAYTLVSIGMAAATAGILTGLMFLVHRIIGDFAQRVKIRASIAILQLILAMFVPQMLSTEPMIRVPYSIDPIVIAACLLICAIPATIGFFMARAEVRISGVLRGLIPTSTVESEHYS